MTTTQLLKSLLISRPARLRDRPCRRRQPIVIALEEGKQIASFKLGDAAAS